MEIITNEKKLKRYISQSNAFYELYFGQLQELAKKAGLKEKNGRNSVLYNIKELGLILLGMTT